MSHKIRGISKMVYKEKGFDFIESSGKIYFVHFSAIQSNGFHTLPEAANVRLK
jgi:cold shock protein